MVAPMFGAAIAAGIYWLLIEAHHPKVEGAQQQQVDDGGGATSATSVTNKGHSPPPASEQ